MANRPENNTDAMALVHKQFGQQNARAAYQHISTIINLQSWSEKGLAFIGYFF